MEIEESFDLLLRSYEEEYSETRNRFRVKRIMTIDDLEYPFCDLTTDEIEEDPIPKTSAEAYKLLTDYYAVLSFINCKEAGLKKYRIWNKHSLFTEIKRIEKFKQESNKEPYYFIAENQRSDSEKHIFQKFYKGLYENSPLSTLIDYKAKSKEANVYGECFHYYEWLKSELFCLRKKDPHYNIAGEPGIQEGSSHILAFRHLFSAQEYEEWVNNFLSANDGINSAGKGLLTKGKGYILFGVIAALKDKTNPSPLNKIYTDEKLLKVFNGRFGFTFKKLKRDSTGFDKIRQDALDSLSKLN